MSLIEIALAVFAVGLVVYAVRYSNRKRRETRERIRNAPPSPYPTRPCFGCGLPFERCICFGGVCPA